MRSNLKLVVNNPHNQTEEKQFFEKDELKIILDLYAKMVSEGSWKDYGLSISSKQVSFMVFKNAAENATGSGWIKAEGKRKRKTELRGMAAGQCGKSSSLDECKQN